MDPPQADDQARSQFNVNWFMPGILFLLNFLLRLLLRVYKILAFSSAVYYVVVTPIEIGFFIYPPRFLLITGSIFSLVCGIESLVNIVKTIQTTHCSPRIILPSLDFVAILPYGVIASYTHHAVVFLLLLRLLQLRWFIDWQDRIDQFFTSRTTRGAFYCLLAFRLSKIVALDLYWMHLSACLLYYTAAAQEDREHTWLGSITTFPGIDFTHFWTLSFWRLYSISTYFSFVTISTVGYGDLHATTLIEGWVVKGILVITGIIVLISAHMGNNLIQKFLRDRNDRRRGPPQQGGVEGGGGVVGGGGNARDLELAEV